MTTRAILLDIEGTVGSVRFVHDVLFPYARDRIGAFVRAEATAEQLDAVRREAGEPGADLDRIEQVLVGWIDADRKATSLKELQGHIWERGFLSGELRSHLYDDAADAIRRWGAAGRTVAIYSSGSVHAQRLYLRHSDHGDLSGHLSGWFDTTTGPKRQASSYTAIAHALGRAPAEVVFYSDVAEELDAAAAAGLATSIVDRARPPTSCGHPSIASFRGIDP